MIMDGKVGVRCALALLVLSVIAPSCPAQQVEVDAVAGTPYGVGRMSVLVDPRSPAETSLKERNGRALYPVFESAPVRQLLRKLVSAPRRVNVYFLFRGDEPLELTLLAPAAVKAGARPRQDPAAHRGLLSAWWREFNPETRRGGAKSEYPQVENYLAYMLAARLNLPAAVPNDPAAELSELERQANLLAGLDALKSAAKKNILLGRVDTGPADLPPPKSLEPEAIDAPPLNKDEVTIEPIALHVPVECFYLRSGNFANFLWLTHRINSWGGDLRNIVSRHGIDYGLNDRFQNQLGVRESALAGLVGGAIIADVARVGMDTFQNEGSAMGMIYHARINQALRSDLMQQRTEAAKKMKDRGAVEEKVLIGDQEVSLVSTPDNALRSFYVVDGDFHLVTNCQTLVERFLQAGRGERSLGKSAEFRLARSIMPVKNNHTAFIYLSEAFSRNLLSPHYRIEMSRRLHSLAEIELCVLGRLTAQGEKRPSETIEQLIAGGYLPEGFGDRPDGSRLVLKGDVAGDSLRGARGTFLPIPDAPIKAVTAAELQAYERFATYYRDRWGRVDPIWIGIQRSDVTGAAGPGDLPRPSDAVPEVADKKPAQGSGLEQVVLDIQATPLSPRHYDFLARWLGPASDKRVAAVPGDLVSLQASLRGGQLFAGPDTILFGGLRNPDPGYVSRPAGLIPGLISGLLLGKLQQDVRGYLAAWPDPGLLRLLGAGSSLPADPNGFSRLRTGIWRRQFNGFTALSFQPEVLAEVTPSFGFVRAAEPGQAWLHSTDLRNSKLAGLINNYGFRAERATTLSNVQFLNSLSHQLHLPPEQALAAAEKILNGRLICPLGGKYLLESGGPVPAWTSTALKASGRIGPDGKPEPYEFPALAWLRGVDVQVRLEEGSIAAHAEVILPAQTEPAAQAPMLKQFELPKLPSFGFPGKAAAKPDAS